MRGLSASYYETLIQNYGEAGSNIAALAASPSYAESPVMQRGQTPYIRADSQKEPESDPTIMFIPGFGESIVNKVSFAAELIRQGANVILPGQNRKGMMYDEYGRPDPMAAQAYNYLAVIKDARKNGETIHFAPHSMASLVMAKMIHLEPELFKDSHIFMLAPAGTIEDETFGSLAKDWFGMIKSESNKNRPVEFPDPRGVTAIASFKSLARNPLRSVREVRSMINERINYQEIIDKVGELIVVSYVQDEMFPEARLAPMLEKAGVRWVSPCDLRGMLNGRINFGGEGSTHDYEQFSPSVVAGCLIKLLSPDLKPQSLDV